MFFQHTQLTQSIHFLVQYLFFSFTVHGLMKNGILSITSISTSIFGHVPIPSNKQNVSLYLYSIPINSSFSFMVKHKVSRSMYFFNILLPVKLLISSSSVKQGNGSVDCCSSFFKVLSSLLNSSYNMCNGFNS